MGKAGVFHSGYRADHATPWRSHIEVDGTNHFLGSFATAEEAALAFDKAARKFYGRRAKVNFPDPKASVADAAENASFYD